VDNVGPSGPHAQKKTLHAAEQARADIAEARHRWWEAQPPLDPARLIFLDETWTKTNITRTRGRARGEQLVASAPHGHWKTAAFLAGLRDDRVVAPLVLDEPVNGAAFRAWVEQFRGPTLAPGDIVIADNLASHKVSGVREAIESRGTSMMFLSGCSPDLNPIEQVFAKLKQLIRSAEPRTRPRLWQIIGSCIGRFTPNECQNYLRNAGYRHSA
jgi:transposase